MPLGGWIEHNYAHWEAITALEETLQTGSGLDVHATMKSPVKRSAYQRAMLETARPVAERVAEMIPVPINAG